MVKVLCDRCNENEASIHIKKTIKGKSTEIHLCDQCAKETKENEIINIPISFQDFLVGLMDLTVNDATFEEQKESQKAKTIKCEKCEMTYADFKMSGKLGCAQCYQTFKKQLPIVFNKLHGHTKHNGKVPTRIEKNMIKEKGINDLKQDLQIAILEEEFEKAAYLRDKIKEMQKGAKI